MKWARANFVYIFSRIVAYISNALVASACSLSTGDPVVWVLTASYDGSNRAVFDLWRPARAVVWELLATDTVFHTNCADFDEWSAEWLPALSGHPSPEGVQGEHRILGARIIPPGDDPLLFLRHRRGRINAVDKTDEGGDQLCGRVRFSDSNATYRRPRARSASRTMPSSG